MISEGVFDSKLGLVVVLVGDGDNSSSDSFVCVGVCRFFRADTFVLAYTGPSWLYAFLVVDLPLQWFSLYVDISSSLILLFSPPHTS